MGCFRTDILSSFDKHFDYIEDDVTDYSEESRRLISALYLEFQQMRKIRYFNLQIRRNKWGSYKDIRRNLKMLKDNYSRINRTEYSFCGCIYLGDVVINNIVGLRKLVSRTIRFKFHSELFVECLLALNSKEEPDIEVLNHIEKNSLKRNEYYYRKGVFISDSADFDECLGLFSGEMLTHHEIETRNSQCQNKFIFHSYYYYHPQLPLVIDMSVKSNVLRFIRRSCRPNTEIRAIIRINTRPEYGSIMVDGVYISLHFGLFTITNISSGTEILLPLDYQNGNTKLRYFCACEMDEFCLSPYPLNRHLGTPIVKNCPEVSKTQKRGRPRKPKQIDNIDTLEPENRMSHMNNPILSREERKLQMYIKTFERIELQQRKQLEDSQKIHPSKRRGRKKNHLEQTGNLETI